MKRFDGKTILVTGAGSGIGAACVRQLFAQGASVVAGDVRKEDVDRVVSEFGGSERIYEMVRKGFIFRKEASSNRLR